MLPEIYIKTPIGEIILSTYKICMAISIILTIYFLFRNLRKYKIEKVKAAAYTTACTAAALICARLFYFALYPVRLKSAADIFSLEASGYTLYGGIFGMTAGIYIVTRLSGIRLLKFMDDSVVYSAVVMIAARIGCLLNGCCYGKATDMPWGIKIAENTPAYSAYIKQNPLSLFTGLPLIHFTQLYEIIVIITALISAILAAKNKKYGSKSGTAALCFGVILTVGRYIVYNYRYFPYAEGYSNFIRGPVIYLSSLILLVFIYLTRDFGKEKITSDAKHK